uniref:DWNN domain-containing protein n=1 Tax=Gouania willdenowi TaxID=441366 RepID=A0A8C5DVK3_GOUWI
MSFIHYKFSSKLEYKTVTFSGVDHLLNDYLKTQIMTKERLKSRHCDLQITDAQTLEGTISYCVNMQCKYFYKLPKLVKYH